MQLFILINKNCNSHHNILCSYSYIHFLHIRLCSKTRLMEFTKPIVSNDLTLQLHLYIIRYYYIPVNIRTKLSHPHLCDYNENDLELYIN